MNIEDSRAHLELGQWGLKQALCYRSDKLGIEGGLATNVGSTSYALPRLSSEALRKRKRRTRYMIHTYTVIYTYMIIYV